MTETYSIAETARRFNCARGTVRTLIDQGLLHPVGTGPEGNGGSDSVLIDFSEAGRVIAGWRKEQQGRKGLPVRQQEALSQAIQDGAILPGTAILLSDGAAKYKVSKQRLSQLVKEGKVAALTFTTGPNGEQRVQHIDEAALAEWAEEYHAKRSKRQGQRKMKGLGRTPRAVQQARPAAEIQQAAKPEPPEGTQSTAMLAKDYFDYLEFEKQRAPDTLRAARYRLSKFIEMYPVLPIGDDAEDDIHLYFRAIGGNRTTPHSMASAVRTFYNWLWRRKKYLREFGDNPFGENGDVEMPDKWDEPYFPLTLEQVHTLLAAVPDMEHYALVYCLVRSGLRRGELRTLRADRLEAPVDDESPGHAAFEHGKRGLAIVPIDPEGYGYLKKIAPPSGYVFHGRDINVPYHADTISNMVQRVFDLAGIDSPVKGPQMLRHTFIALFKTRATNAGMSAQVARHDIDMNTRVYGRLGSGEIDAEYMKVVPNIPMPPPPAHLGMQGQMAMEGG